MKPLLKDMTRTALTVSVAMVGIWSVAALMRSFSYICGGRRLSVANTLQIVTLGDEKSAMGVAINDRGEAIGVALEGKTVRGFVVRGKKMQLLPLPKGGEASAAADINDDGAIVGTVRIGGKLRGVLWRGDQIGVLTGGQKDTFGITVSKAGVAAGFALEGPPPPMLPRQLLEPFTALDEAPMAFLIFGMLWKRSGEGKEIGAFEPVAGNANGTLLGKRIEEKKITPTLYRAGQLVSLPSPEGAQIVMPAAVNKSEVAVGGVLMREGERMNMCPIGWSNGKTGLLPVPGGRAGVALGINDAKIIVGAIDTGDGPPHAAVWKDGKVIDLNDAVRDKKGWTLIQARDINNKGQIVGTAMNDNRSTIFILGCPQK